MKHFITCIACILSFLLLYVFQSNVHAVSLYEQNLDSGLDGAYSLRYSGNQKIADDFVLLQQSNVNKIIWYGYYVSTDDNKNYDSTSPFDIVFYSDNNGPADKELELIDLDYAIEDTGYDSIFLYGEQEYRLNIYKYIYNLNSPYNINSGEKKWLSLLGENNWLWSRSDSDGSYYHRSTGNWDEANNGNFAFKLMGDTTPVPEPTTWLLFGTGLLSLVGLSRKKFFKKS